MRSLRLVALTTGFACSTLGCSSEVGTTSADALLLVGLEADPWSIEPTPIAAKVDLLSAGQRLTIGEAKAPFATVTIRDPGVPSGSIGTFEVAGLDAEGTPVVGGATVPFLLYGITGVRIPIFVGRTNSWSRPPDLLRNGRGHPVVTTAFHQYLISAGGEVAADFDSAIPDVYDFSTWSPLKDQPRFPRSPKTMLVVGSTVLCIDDVGATWLDLTDDRIAVAPIPAGLTSYGEVAGGGVWQLADSSYYVVGGTRPAGDPTAKVLRVNKDGLISSISLNTPRTGAAAGVVGGNLVVWGGSADGSGVEVLNKALDGFVPLPFPADPTTGLGLVALDETTALLAGGKDPTTSSPATLRTFDATCSMDCAAAELVAFPVAIERTKIFPLAAGHMLITGEAADGEFHAHSLLMSSDVTELVERPLRQRRRNATALLLPNSHPGVVGGQDPDSGTPILTIESFIP